MSNHQEAKERVQGHISTEHGVSADHFGHKDYYAARDSGKTDQEILSYLDQNADQLRGKNRKGGGNLYDSIADGSIGYTPKTPQVIGSIGNTTNAIDNSVTADNDSVETNHQITQEQNVNQDNDINTSVTGDNNTVITEQDNSIRQYGGDNRSFNYISTGLNGGGNPFMDTPVSAATMSGFYAPDDSPAAQAKFNDMFTTMNRDNQKRYAGDAMKTYNMFGKIDTREYTPQSMQNLLGKSTQYSFDRADRQTGHVFGDIWNPNYITEQWKMPSAPKEIESNAGEIADKAKDDIEDI